MGGKPSKGTPADKRLKPNQPKSAAPKPVLPPKRAGNYGFTDKTWLGQ